jgi:hypothetical protein
VLATTPISAPGTSLSGAGAPFLPAEHDADRHQRERERDFGRRDVGRQAEQAAGHRREILEAARQRLRIEQHVELADHDQHADAGEHAVDDGGRDRAEPAAEAEHAGDDLDQSGEHQDRAERRKTLIADEFEHDDGEAGGGAADLQRRSGERTDDDAADDAGDQALFGRHARCDRRCPCRAASRRGRRRSTP